LSKKTVCPHGCGKEWIGTTNRRAELPLDREATAAANQDSAANCPRIANPDGTIRQLTMSDDDYYCRRMWMDAYLEALARKKAKKVPPKIAIDPEEAIVPCPKANLIVRHRLRRQTH